MKGPGQKIVINFGTGSPEGNGGPSHFAHRSMSQWCDHHMRKKRVLPNAKRFKRIMREGFWNLGTSSRSRGSYPLDCGGPEYAVRWIQLRSPVTHVTGPRCAE